AQLGQRRGGGRAGQAGADDEDAVLALVGGVDQLHVEAVLVPLGFERPGRDFGIELHGASSFRENHLGGTSPNITASGMAQLPISTTTATTGPTLRMTG